MENLGALAIMLAFCVALYATAASVIGRVKSKPFLIVSGERAVYATWTLLTLAAAILVTKLLTGDFPFAYVAEHADAVQVRGMVGRTGRFAAAVELAPGDLYDGGRIHQSAPPPRLHALGP